MSASSLLWSLEPPGGKVSYLFGTMHIRDDRVYRLCHALYPLILDSDIYVGEMDLASSADFAGQPVYDMKAFFSQKVYQKIRSQFLKSFSLDIDRYAHLHPLMIMSAISQTMLDHDHTVSLDEHLWNYAKKHHLLLSGLESLHEQVTLLHAIEPEPLYTHIRNTSAHPNAIRKFTEMALAYYVQGNIHRLYMVTKSSMHRLRKQIIYKRNKLMVERICGFDPSLRYFITVGAGHLSGPAGILSSLRKAGYSVRAVKIEEPIDSKSSSMG